VSKQQKRYFLTKVDFPIGFEEDGKAEIMIEKTLDIIEVGL
jgi:hypothetical protein